MPMDLPCHYHDMQIIDKMSMVNNLVLIEVFDNRDMTQSGIKIPITSENPFVPEWGIVYKMPNNITEFKVGDKVAIQKYKGTRFYSDIDNRQFLMLDASYILAIITD